MQLTASADNQLVRGESEIAVIYEPIPQKQCITCKQWYPDSTEAFCIRKLAHRDALRGECRWCWNARKADSRKRHPDTRERYYQEHRSVIVERAAKWVENNRGKFNERNRKAAQRRRKADLNKAREIGRKESAKFKKANPEKVRAWNSQRRSRVAALPHTFTIADWEHALEYFHNVCAYCGNTPRLWDNPATLHQEHHIPASKGGGYTPDNIVPACPRCNLEKKDRDAREWLVGSGRYSRAEIERILERIQRYFEVIRNG